MGPNLTPRLAAVAQWVPEGARLVDVGTDHGYLPARLLADGNIPSAIATDLRPGPLDKARETMERWGVTDRVCLRLCDGLADVAPGEADVITITGMGGETILQILARSPWSAGKRCIVQPMTAVEDLRADLDGLSMHIVRERLVEEGRTLYVILELAPGGEVLTPAECWVGKAAAHIGTRCGGAIWTGPGGGSTGRWRGCPGPHGLPTGSASQSWKRFGTGWTPSKQRRRRIW